MVDSIAQDLAAIARVGTVPLILKTIAESTGLRFTFVARVTEERWIACAIHDTLGFGLEVGGELDVKTTLCREVRSANKAIIIDKASVDLLYKDHPTPKMYGFESYISVPFYRQNGEYFGTVCGLDPIPQVLSDGKTLAMIELFGNLISLQMQADEARDAERTAMNAELDAQREASQLREQFIAVLGHDVRNPLGAITMGTELLLRRAKEDADVRVLQRLRASAKRIATLVDDVLDLARGRLGGGIAIKGARVDDLVARLQHVTAELQSTHPERRITIEVARGGSVHCDETRIEQLLSNLLANAIEHGAAGTPITVSLGGDDATFELRVTNAGEPIPDETRARLFQPYFRGGASGRRDGLGLGLFIVSEIARSHAGQLDVVSTTGHTAFVFTMPREGPGESASSVEPPLAPAS